MGPRVFISSVMQDFGDYRAAARAAVEECGGIPVLIEDFPALAVSPRTACLDGVMSCDALLSIVARRGGWRAPSGKLAIEEEYDEAHRRGRRTLVFAQGGECDQDANEFLARASDWVDGQLRPTFNTPADLKREIIAALPGTLELLRLRPTNPMEVNAHFERPEILRDQTTLRIALQPERTDELIKPAALEERELINNIYEAGHGLTAQLLSYERKKLHTVGLKEIVMVQTDEDWRNGLQLVRIELRTNGTLIIDANVTGREGSTGFGLHSNMRVVDQDVADQVRRGFLFAGTFFDRLDPFKRFDRFYFNASLVKLDYRTFGPPLASQGGIPMGDHGSGPHLAFDTPLMVRREDLSAPQQIASDVIAMFSRRLSAR